MGTLTSFAYFSGISLCHRLDVRTKLACMCCLCVATLHSGPIGLGAVSVIISGLCYSSGLKWIPVFRSLRYFLLLLCAVVLTRALTTSGTAFVSLTLPGFDLILTQEGLQEGILIAWRFLTVMLLSLIFTVTTQPSHVKGAVEWFLKPVPGLPEQRIAVMISLFLKFLPLILTQADQVLDAQKSRLGNLQRNPAKRLSRIALPLLKNTVRSADRLTLAMAARCYSEDRTDPEFQTSGREWPVLAATMALCTLMIVCP